MASLTWDPGIRGILVVVVGGGRAVRHAAHPADHQRRLALGFHIAATAIFGWLTLMFLFWAIYALGYKGPAPTWQVLDLSTNPAGAVHKQLHTVPQPDAVGDPVNFQKSNKLVAEAMKGRTVLPTMGDVVAADPSVAKKLAPKLNGWRLLPTSDADNRDAAAATGEYLQANGFAGLQFQSSSSYLVGTVFDRGGKPLRKDGSMMQRVTHRIETTAMALIGDNPAHYAVVQVQPAIAQTSLPGEPPAQPVADPNQPVINVLHGAQPRRRFVSPASRSASSRA